MAETTASARTSRSTTSTMPSGTGQPPTDTAAAPFASAPARSSGHDDGSTAASAPAMLSVRCTGGCRPRRAARAPAPEQRQQHRQRGEDADQRPPLRVRGRPTSSDGMPWSAPGESAASTSPVGVQARRDVRRRPRPRSRSSSGSSRRRRSPERRGARGGPPRRRRRRLAGPAARSGRSSPAGTPRSPKVITIAVRISACGSGSLMSSGSASPEERREPGRAAGGRAAAGWSALPSSRKPSSTRVRLRSSSR